MSHTISELLQVSMDSLKEMIDANTIIGTPLKQNDITIIPVSKVHLGFVSGGSDIKSSSNKDVPLFGGGTGGGLSVTPIAFLVLHGSEIELLSIDEGTHLMEKLIDVVPKTIDKAKTLFKNNAPIEKV